MMTGPNYVVMVLFDGEKSGLFDYGPVWQRLVHFDSITLLTSDHQNETYSYNLDQSLTKRSTINTSGFQNGPRSHNLEHHQNDPKPYNLDP